MSQVQENFDGTLPEVSPTDVTPFHCRVCHVFYIKPAPHGIRELMESLKTAGIPPTREAFLSYCEQMRHRVVADENYDVSIKISDTETIHYTAEEAADLLFGPE